MARGRNSHGGKRRVSLERAQGAARRTGFTLAKDEHSGKWTLTKGDEVHTFLSHTGAYWWIRENHPK